MLIYPGFDPIALQLGPVAVRWYGLAYVAGMLGGLWYSKKIAVWHKAKNLTPDTLENFFIWAVIGIVAGGRLGYALFYGLDHLLRDPLWLLRVWEGGMSFHGGAAGVIAAILIFAHHYKVHPADLADRIVPVVPLGLFFGRIANFINGELWGRHVPNPDAVPWAMVFPAVDPLPRHPSQLYEAGLEGIILGLLLWFIVRKGHAFRRWVPSGVFLLGYAATRTLAEFFREPEITHNVLGLSITQGQTLSLPLALGGLLCLYLGYAHTPTRK
ncbi:MAG TPA: prolipoprotein diacylglyceryl transferase [Alphaproteobacteria bacterium]|nr:prolipoprotein diacylglyceryl transferase [Alphaproteobacteria bacterium]